MVRARCVPPSGLEGEKWPATFAVVPRVGEHVEAASGARLRVATVAHLSVSAQTARGNALPVQVEIVLEQDCAAEGCEVRS